jgi:hypothetical protein
MNREFYDKTWRKYVKTVTLVGTLNPNPVLRQLQRTASLEHLHLQDLPHLTDADLVDFITKLTALSSLSILSCGSLTNASIIAASSLPQLTEIQFASLSDITDEAFAQMTHLSRLASLIFIKMPRITDLTLEAVLGGCTKSLKTLLLHECDQISSAPLHHLTRMHSLEIVSVSNMERVRSNIWNFLHGLTALEELSISCGPHLTDENIGANLTTLTSLKILNLNGNHHSEASLRNISALFNLEYLDLSGVASVSGQLFEVLTPLTALRSLLLSVTDQFAPNDMNILARCLPQLEYLSLYDAVNDQWCHSIGLSSFPNLRHLFLEDSDAITDTGAQFLAPLAQLESLSLSGMEITERGLVAALRSMNHLTYLDLHGCHMLDDESIIAAASHLSELVHLRLNNNSGLTDRCLEVLTTLPKVETISLAKCPNFTNKAIRNISLLAPQVSFLDLSYCNGITNDAVRYMEYMHNLQVLYADGSRITHSGLAKMRSQLEEYSASPDPQRRCIIS